MWIGRALDNETKRFDPADLVAPKKGSIEQKIVMRVLVIPVLSFVVLDGHFSLS
jgi:hypothetical protein